MLRTTKNINHHVAIIGGDFAFPLGGAASSRVRCLAKGMLAQGARVHVLHLNCTERTGKKIQNIQNKGIHEGIPFEYTPGTTIISDSFFKRRKNNFIGLTRGLHLLYRLHRDNRLDWIYLYERNAKTVIPVILFGRLLKIPVVLELNEWLPALSRYSHVQRMIFLKFTLKNVQGIVSISSYLIGKVKNNNRDLKRDIPILHVPILSDINSQSGPSDSFEQFTPYLLWCGDLNAYEKSAYFMINVLYDVHQKRPDIKLVLVGNISPEVFKRINCYRQTLHLPDESLVITGYVDEKKRNDLYSNASALLLPLFFHEKDLSRFPTKIAEYFASGRPIVATGLGEILRYTKDGVNAVLVDHAGGHELFSEKVIHLITDPALSKKIGSSGKQTGFYHFSHEVHGKRILSFAQKLLLKTRKIKAGKVV